MEELPETFDEWIDQFHAWQKKIGFDSTWIGDFEMIEKFDWERAGDVIEFGDFSGQKKWLRSLQIPHQNNMF